MWGEIIKCAGLFLGKSSPKRLERSKKCRGMTFEWVHGNFSATERVLKHQVGWGSFCRKELLWHLRITWGLVARAAVTWIVSPQLMAKWKIEIWEAIAANCLEQGLTGIPFTSSLWYPSPIATLHTTTPLMHSFEHVDRKRRKDPSSLILSSVPNPDHRVQNDRSDQSQVKLNLPGTGVYKLLCCPLNLKRF